MTVVFSALSRSRIFLAKPNALIINNSLTLSYERTMYISLRNLFCKNGVPFDVGENYCDYEIRLIYAVPKPKSFYWYDTIKTPIKSGLLPLFSLNNLQAPMNFVLSDILPYKFCQTVIRFLMYFGSLTFRKPIKRKVAYFKRNVIIFQTF